MIFLKRGVGVLWGTLTELDRTFDVILSYSRFYVNPPVSSVLNLKREQGIVRPSHHQLPGPITVRRRSAAQECANAHTGAHGTRGTSENGSKSSKMAVSGQNFLRLRRAVRGLRREGPKSATLVVGNIPVRAQRGVNTRAHAPLRGTSSAQSLSHTRPYAALAALSPSRTRAPTPH